MEVKPHYHLFGHAHEGYGTIKQNGIVFSNASVLDDQYRMCHTPKCWIAAFIQWVTDGYLAAIGGALTAVLFLCRDYGECHAVPLSAVRIKCVVIFRFIVIAIVESIHGNVFAFFGQIQADFLV